MLIKTKTEFYEAQEKLLTGNRFRKWNSIKEIIDSGYSGYVYVRSKVHIAKNARLYNVRLKDLEKMLNEHKLKECDATFIESADDSFKTFQGELTRMDGILRIRYNTIKKPMMYGFEEEVLYADGLKALILLRSYMCHNSLEFTLEVLDCFNERTNTVSPIIEFSCFSRSVGEYGWNTIFWEIRNY